MNGDSSIASSRSTVRNLWMAALTTLALLTGFTVFFAWDSWRIERSRTLQTLKTTAEVQSRALEQYLQRHERSLQYLASALVDENGQLIAPDQVHVELRKAAEREIDWTVALLNDIDGKLVQSSRTPSSGAPPNTASPGADWAYSMEELRRGAKLSIGRGVRGRITGEWVVPLRYGVRDRNGALVHVVVASMPLARPISFWEGAQFPLGGGVTVILLQDVVHAIGRYPLPGHQDAGDIYGKPRKGNFASSLLRGDLPSSGTFEAESTISSTSTLFGYARLTRYPLAFVIQSPTALLFDQWWSRVWLTFVMLGVMGLASATAFPWLIMRERGNAARRALAEQALRESEMQLRRAETLTRSGYYAFDADGGNFVSSPELKNLYGFEPDSMVPYSECVSRLHPDDRDRVMTEVKTAALEMRGFDMEYRIVRPNGMILTLHSISEFSRGDVGAPPRFFGALMDVTEHRKLQDAVRVSEERLSLAVKGARDGIWDWNPRTGEDYLSPRWKEILGYADEELANRDSTFFDLMHPDDRAVVEQAVKRHFEQGAPFDLEIRLRHKDGTYRWVQSRGEAVRDTRGQVIRMLGSITDITSRKNAEIALEASLQEKDTLLREIHHRVKNNLQIISSLLNFQARKAKSTEGASVFREGQERLKSMILVHEKLYRAESLAQIEFGDYLRSLATQLRDAYRTRRGKVILQLEVAPLHLPIEVALPCGMLLTELLTNAYKYAFPGERTGTLRVELQAQENQFRLVVQDDGVGLPEGMDPQSPEGFGLQLVANLAEQLGAELHFERDAGLRISVIVPLMAKTEAASAMAA